MPACVNAVLHVLPPSFVTEMEELGPLATQPVMASRKKMSSCLPGAGTVGPFASFTQLVDLMAASYAAPPVPVLPPAPPVPAAWLELAEAAPAPPAPVARAPPPEQPETTLQRPRARPEAQANLVWCMGRFIGAPLGASQ